MLFRFLIAALFALFALPAAAADAKITVYSAGPADLIDKLAKGFTRATGIGVDVFQATTGKVMARIEAEASNPAVDVVVSASRDSVDDFAKRGWLLELATPSAGKVPDALKSKFAIAQGVSALAIAWNPKSKTPRPAEWEDLTRGAYRDLVTVPDPAQSGASFELVAGLHAKAGSWDLFSRLKANGAIVAGANADALNPVLQGAKAAVFGAVDYISLAQRAQGESIEVIFPASGTVIAPRPMMIFNWSKHKEEAKKFVDYNLSDAGQTEIAKAYLVPARADVAAARPLMKDIRILSVDTPAVYARRDAILAEFASTMRR